MTRLPRRVKIGGHVWTVERVAIDTDLDVYGRTIARHSRIEIDGNQVDDQERETVLHELLHALARSCPAFPDDHEQEEAAVTVLTPWLLALLRDNPALVTYLTERA